MRARDDLGPAREAAGPLLACPRCRAVFSEGGARGPLRDRCPLDGGRLVPEASDPRVGTWLSERYLAEELVGVGRIGRLYRCRDLRARVRPVVLVLDGDLAADPAARARFEREAERASRRGAAGLERGASREGVPFLAIDDPDPALVAALLAVTSTGELTRALERTGPAAPDPDRPRSARRVRLVGLSILALLVAAGSAGAAAVALGDGEPRVGAGPAPAGASREHRSAADLHEIEPAAAARRERPLAAGAGEPSLEIVPAAFIPARRPTSR